MLRIIYTEQHEASERYVSIMFQTNAMQDVPFQHTIYTETKVVSSHELIR